MRWAVAQKFARTRKVVWVKSTCLKDSLRLKQGQEQPTSRKSAWFQPLNTIFRLKNRHEQ